MKQLQPRVTSVGVTEASPPPAGCDPLPSAWALQVQTHRDAALAATAEGPGSLPWSGVWCVAVLAPRPPGFGSRVWVAEIFLRNTSPRPVPGNDRRYKLSHPMSLSSSWRKH